jgi:tetratricopeptide (TPR) repeat protein
METQDDSAWWWCSWSTLLSLVFAAALSLVMLGATLSERKAAVAAPRKCKKQGDKLFQKKRYQEALEKYQECCIMIDDDDNTARLTRIEGFYGLAKTYQKLHMLTEAIEAAQDGLDTAAADGFAPHAADELEMLMLKLNEAKKNRTCRHCGKTPALELCGRCQRAVYCTADCQAAHWPYHKEHECFSDKCTDTASSKAAKTAHCQNCFTLLNKACKQLMCSRCDRSPYCSRSCQQQHFPLHKLICMNSASSDQSIDELGIPALTAWRRLFDSWKEKSPEYLCYLATFAMSKRDFVQQPPTFVIVVKVAFNYNYGTFLPIGNPQKVAITSTLASVSPERLQQEINNVCRYRARTGRTDVVGHVVVVETETPLLTASTMPIIVPASAFQSEPNVVSGMKDFCLFPQQQYLSRWRPLMLHNLSYQISFLRHFKDEIVFAKFVAAALRLHSRKPRDQTHVLFVYFEPGLFLGEIQKLTEFEVEALEKAQDSLSGIFATRAELQSVLQKYFRPRRSSGASGREQVKHIPIFFCSDAGTTMSEVSIAIAAGQGNQTNPSCKEVAREAFSELQSVPLPPVQSPGFDQI